MFKHQILSHISYEVIYKFDIHSSYIGFRITFFEFRKGNINNPSLLCFKVFKNSNLQFLFNFFEIDDLQMTKL